MSAKGRPVGTRPRWPDLVITVAIVGLTAVGVAALFGSSIRGWFRAEPAAPAASTIGVPGGAPL